MIFTPKIEKAIGFAIKVHEIDQKQKRKGKDVPYVIHPLTVGLILARVGAGEDLVVAGILHDAIEDSIEDNRVTRDIVSREFGEEVGRLVGSVSEVNKQLSWEDRKREALENIKSFSNESVMLKSADIISNITEIFSDYNLVGDAMFGRFSAGKNGVLKNYKNVTRALLDRWNGNPLKNDLEHCFGILEKMEE